MNQEAQQRIMGYFIEEARDHLGTIEQGLLGLKDNISDPELINELFRAAHSIKGGSAMLGLSSIQRTAHRMEDFFNVFRSNPGKVPVDQHLETLLLRQFDTLSILLEQLQSPQGLLEEVSKVAMADLEPIFSETETHIQNLMSEGVSAAAPTPTPAPAPTAPTLQSVMEQTVPQVLRNMLELFKQGDSSAVREKLLKLSQSLKGIGAKFQLPGWQKLSESLVSALQNPRTELRNLAMISLRDLKQARELVLNGQDQRITPSKELLALAGSSSLSPSQSTKAPAMTEAQRRILGFFLEEAAEHLETLEQGLLNLKTNHDDIEFIQDLFRASHSIKGGSAQLGLTSVQQISHRMEDFFSIFRDRVGQVPVDQHLESLLLKGYDTLSKLLTHLQDTGDLPEEMGEAAWTEMEPVFDETEAHINRLLKGESIPATAISAVQPTSQPIPQPQPTPAPAMTDAQRRILGFFLEEAAEHLETLEQGLLNLRASHDDLEFIQDLFRASHSIKGGSAQLGLTSVQRISHRMEDFFSIFRDHVGQVPVDQHLEGLLLKGYDQLSKLLKHLQNTGELPEEMGEASVAEMEPVFAETEAYIHQLLSGGATEVADSSKSAWDTVVQQDIPNLLRQLLEQFKQSAQSDTRPDAQQTLQALLAIGVSYQLPQWSMLVQTVQDILAQSTRPLKDLAMPILQDLRQAHDLLQADQEDRIQPSSELLALKPVVAEPIEDEALGELFGDAGDLGSLFDFDNLDDSMGDMGSDDLSTGIVLTGVDTGLTDGFEPMVDEGSLSDLFDSMDGDDLLDDVASAPTVDLSGPEDFNPAPLELGDDDEMAFADLFANAEELAAIEDEPELATGLEPTNLADPDVGMVSPAAASRGDSDLADLFADVTDTADVSLFATERNDEAFFSDLFGQQDPPEPSNDLSGYSDAGELSFEELFDAKSATEVEGSEFEKLDALFGESTDDLLSMGVTPAPSAIDTNGDGQDDLDELSRFLDDPLGDLSTSEPASTQADPLASLENELDALLQDGPSSASPSVSQWDELDALLGDELPLPSAGSGSAGSLDELDALLDDLAKDAPAQPSVTVELSRPPKVDKPVAARAGGSRKSTGFSNQTMRVEVRHLDSINNLVGELVVNRNSMEQNQGRLRQFLEGLLNRVQQLGDLGTQMQDQYDRSLLETALLSSRTEGTRAVVAVANGGGSSRDTHSGAGSSGAGGHLSGKTFDALEMDRFTAFHALSQEIIELIVRVRESASDIEFAVDEAEQVARQFRQVTTQLQEGLNKARMVPFSQIADRLPRAIRDLSIKTHKQAALEVEGRETSIDKAILEELYDPMTHLVNNALVHGIEMPDDRRRSGKSPEGRISIRAFYQGNQTIIVVSDDGGGINTDKVKNKAMGLGLLSAEATEDEVFDVLFHPGFSGRSAEEVDDLAGRGVGLDVVRRNISELRGTIQIDSIRGKGTTFTIRLPLTLSISKAMVCVSDKALVAFPLDGVEEMLDVPQDEIQIDEEGHPTIPWRDQRLAYQPLSELLAYSRMHSRGRAEVYSISQDEGIVPIVILQSAGQYVALQVDSFVEEQEIVIKQLRGPASKPPGIAGATVLGNGRVLPIADIIELVDMAHGRGRRDVGRQWADQMPTEAEQEHQTTVLIIDDSITVRELLSMTFNKVGYRVEQARDGQDAWEKLRGGLPCDLIFCDIEMPRMDGLELLTRLREDEVLQELPIAMLTSRGAERHRQTARELGATAYFTKPYLEEELLSAAAKMLKGEVLLTAAKK